MLVRAQNGEPRLFEISSADSYVELFASDKDFFTPNKYLLTSNKYFFTPGEDFSVAAKDLFTLGK